MPIFNTISLVPSGSKGFPGEVYSDTGITEAVDYVYVPYEGSFLAYVTSDLTQPFSPEPASGQAVYDNTLDNLVSPPQDGQTVYPPSVWGTLNDAYPLSSQEGLSILRFPRLDQNPQINPSSAYYPYNTDGNTIDGKIAEFTSLPSIHLQLTIQPVQFFDRDWET